MRISIVSLLGTALLAGCVTSTPPTAVHQPMTARPAARNEIPPANGAPSAAPAVKVFADLTQ